MLSHLGLELLKGLQTVTELLLTLLFLVLPRDGNLFDFFNFFLFKIGLEFGLFGSFPHFELPNSLVVNFRVQTGWHLALGSLGSYLSTGFVHRFGNTIVLQVDYRSKVGDALIVLVQDVDEVFIHSHHG